MKKQGWRWIVGLSLMVLLVLGGILFFRQKKYQNTVASNKVVMGYTQFPANIDPAKEYNGWFTVRYGVGETLFKMTDQLAVTPWLASKGTQLSSNEWEIQIRDDLTFQNGKKVTGEKVKTSLERLLAQNKRAASDLGIDQIRASDQTVWIVTKHPQPLLLNLLAEPYATIIDSKGKEKTGKSIVGTGPYIMTEFRPENGALLRANEHYWAGKVSVKEVEIRSFSDPTSMSLALGSGEIDAAYGLPAANLANYKKRAGYRISQVDGSRFLAYVYNFLDPIIQDVRVRKAIDLVLERRAYSQSLFQGAIIPAVGAFPETFSFALKKKVVRPNQKEAQNLLDQAGYIKQADGYRYKDGKKMTLTVLSYNRLPEIPLAVQATQAELKAIGVDVRIRLVEVGALATEKDYSFTAYTMVAAPVGDPYPFFKGSVASDGAVNLGHYQNAQVDHLIQELAITASASQRNDLSQAIQEQMEKDQMMSFLGTFKVAVIMNHHISGLSSSASDYYHLTYQLKKEP